MKTNKPKLNVELLRQVKAAILKEPVQFQMGLFFRRWARGVIEIPNCGTSACIGGWALAIFNKINPLVASEKVLEPFFKAREAIGLTERQAEKLFMFEHWPRAFQKVGDGNEGSKEFARQAARRIDHFIKYRK